MRTEAVNRFINNIERLLKGEAFNMYEEMVSSHFEYIAAEILTEQLEDGIWFDGVSGLVAKTNRFNQVEFSGEMYVCRYQEKFWKEPFFARVTDSRNQNGLLNIYVKIGNLENEKDLLSMDWLYLNT